VLIAIDRQRINAVVGRDVPPDAVGDAQNPVDRIAERIIAARLFEQAVGRVALVGVVRRATRQQALVLLDGVLVGPRTDQALGG